MVEGSAPVSPGATQAIGRRASMLMVTVSGRLRCTLADFTSGMRANAFCAASRLSEKMFSPSRIPVLESTSSRVMTPSVFTSTMRTS